MRSLVQLILTWDWQPATKVSSGASKVEHWGMTRGNTLYAPVNDRIQPIVSGLLQDARAASRCNDARRVQEFQTRRKIMVDLGLIIVLEAESSHKQGHLCMHRVCLPCCTWITNQYNGLTEQKCLMVKKVV